MSNNSQPVQLYHCKYRDATAITRKFRRNKQGAYKSTMAEEELQGLKEIVDERPYIYLDEIREEVYEVLREW